jgi:IMP dehydrogenase
MGGLFIAELTWYQPLPILQGKITSRRGPKGLSVGFTHSKDSAGMAKIIETATGLLALTFDDVLLQPGHSEVMPGDTDVRTRIAGDIELNMPILSAAMDTVTEARLAIAMAQAGGLGVIHRNFSPVEQAEQVRQVKKFESGMVVNPVTIGPDATLADAQALMRTYSISGIPVVENGGAGGHKVVSPTIRGRRSTN